MNRWLEVLASQRRYHDEKPLASLLLRMLDLLLLLLPRRAAARAGPPRRILLMNPAYIGDVLMSTSVLPLLRRTYPNATIGFAVGSWARQVVQGHPDVSQVHVIDLFRLNRSKFGLANKLRQQWRTQRQAKREIVSLDYDVAIDLFTGFPPLSWFAWACAIPRRIGYMNRGFGALLTEPHSLLVVPGKHEVGYHVDLAVALGAARGTGFDHPSLGVPTATAVAAAAAALGWPKLEQGPYIVIHPGSGERLREWPVSKWREVVAALIAESRTVVFTGHGSHEAALIEQIVDGIQGPINLCGKLNWESLCALVSRANLLIGIESMSGHLAAAWQVPTITLSTGMADPQRWKPASQNGVSLHTAPPCLPCLNRTGCESMRCVRNVMPAQVLDAAEQHVVRRTRHEHA